MVSAPQNPIQSARLGTVFAVRIGDKEGNPPGEADEFTEVIPLLIELGTGGRELDRASFQINLGATGQHIVDFQVDPKMNRQVEVYAIDEEGEFELLFWGEYDQQNMEINPDGEFVVITASTQKHHFGTPITGAKEYDKVLGETVQTDRDLVFNPKIENGIYGNRYKDPDYTKEGEFDPEERYLIVPPEAGWTQKAKDYLDEPLEPWTIPDVVDYLCQLTNAEESLVKNPLSIAEKLKDAPALKNFTIRRGVYLPEALDEILEPHGYWWHVNCFATDYGNGLEASRYIRLGKLGEGVEKQVYHQRPGESLDIAKGNAPDLEIDTNISELSNRATVQGDFIKKEVAVELKKCWAPAQDSLTPDELQRKDEAGSQFEQFPNVHRKWAFGEGGDYIGLRPEFGSAPAELTFFDVEAGEEYVHRRRKTEPLLTYDRELNRRRQYLEYYDNSTAAWKPVPPEWGYRVLDDEIGVYFTGNKPPSEFWDQGSEDIDNMRLRMTCVIACDKRISYTAEKRDSSPNSREIELFIDASDRLFKQTVHESSPFYGDEELNNAEVDSTTAIQTYAEQLRDVNDSANIQVNIPLFGIYHSYERGDLITKIDGRNISLNRNSSDAEEKKYPQVTGIKWDYEHQRTVLVTMAYQKQVRVT